MNDGGRGVFTPLVGTEHLTEVERVAMARAGYIGKAELPSPDATALVVVDVTWGFCGPRGADLLEAITAYPHACGPSAWEAVDSIARLVGEARDHDVPVVFTRPAVRLPGRLGVGVGRRKNPRQAAELPEDAFDVVRDCGYRPTDVLLEKEAPSAFIATPLLRWFNRWGIRNVVVCGGTTSGCVRATAVDAFSHELAVTVVADATFDRIQRSHEVSLLDLELKYATVTVADRLTDAWGPGVTAR